MTYSISAEANGQLWLRGPGAERAVDRLVTNDVGKLGEGRALYTCCVNEAGTILDDLIVYRVAAGDVLIVCNAGNLEKMSAVFRAADAPDAQTGQPPTTEPVSTEQATRVDEATKSAGS